MRRNESAFCAAVFAAMMIILLGMFAATASAAGGEYPYGQDNRLGGSTSLGNNPYYNSSISNGEDDGSGWFSLRLDPEEVSFNSADWSFYTNYYDPSQWTATAYLYGFREDSESYPQRQYWSQTIDGPGESLIYEYLSFSCQQYDWQEKPEMSVSGTFNIQSGLIDSFYFTFSEYEEKYWLYESDDYILVPAWKAEYRITGHFLADTPEEAQAMGAQYVQGVPEPSTLVLLGIGVLSSVVLVWSRKS